MGLGLGCRAHKYSDIILFSTVLGLAEISTKPTQLLGCHHVLNLQRQSFPWCLEWSGSLWL